MIKTQGFRIPLFNSAHYENKDEDLLHVNQSIKKITPPLIMKTKMRLCFMSTRVLKKMTPLFLAIFYKDLFSCFSMQKKSTWEIAKI